MTTESIDALHITRIFAAPPDVVFRAWGEPDMVRRWWAPRGFMTLACDMDPRPGGAWRVGMRSPAGRLHAEGGVYREVSDRERLVFTQAWEDHEGRRGAETLVTVLFRKHEEATTKVVFQQAGFTTASSRDAHEAGWSSCFDLLAEALAHPERGDLTPGLEETRIRAVLEGHARALHERNAARAVSHYAPDAVLFDVAPPLRQQRRDLGALLDEWFATWKGPVGYEGRDLRIVVGAGVAFSTSLQRLHGERTDGERTDVWLRATYGFRKDGGDWVIAAEHLSVPFYMDGSERAATDLTP